MQMGLYEMLDGGAQWLDKARKAADVFDESEPAFTASLICLRNASWASLLF